MTHSLRIRRAAALLLVAVLTAGCFGQPVDEAAVGGDDALGVVAEPLAPADAKVAQGEADAKQRRRRNRRQREGQSGQAQGTNGGTGSGATTADDVARPAGAAQQPPAGGGGAPQPGQQPAAPFVVLSGTEDRSGDAGAETPGYADAQRVVIESNGQVARVSVVMTADVPGALADGEVEGIGVNFFRSNDEESDYQLFADGGYKGWRAFLHTPDGIQPYQGAFRVGGNILVFEMPWAALGGVAPAKVGVFVDWTQKRELLAASGNDRAPNDGTMTVRPGRR